MPVFDLSYTILPLAIVLLTLAITHLTILKPDFAVQGSSSTAQQTVMSGSQSNDREHLLRILENREQAYELIKEIRHEDDALLHDVFKSVLDHIRSQLAATKPSHDSDDVRQPPAHGTGYRTVAYFVNWAIYARKHRPQDLPVEDLTHILYAFANVKPDTGEVHLTDTWADTDIHWDGDSWNDPGTNLYGCLKQLNLLKRRNRNLKVLLSIGGWTYSSNFRQPASTPSGRSAFAKSAVDLVKNLGFDGLDIDWEYPANAAEGANFVDLLKACREELDSYARTVPGNPHFEMSVACPAGAQNYMHLDIPGMDRYLDFWNVMAYDYSGSWDGKAGHQANLFPSSSNPSSTPFSTVAAVDHYLSHGARPDKLVLGMPLYGRAFENTAGAGKPYSGIGDGTWEKGVYDYKALPLEGAHEHEDHELGASYCYHPDRKTLVSYDTVGIAKRKAKFVKERGLGGAMWWESSADKTGEESLIKNVVDALGGPGSLNKDENCLTYPESKYDNVRNGFASG